MFRIREGDVWVRRPEWKGYRMYTRYTMVEGLNVEIESGQEVQDQKH